jgi:hypothetical protein
VRYRTCPHCLRRRPVTSFHGNDHSSTYCRVCQKLRRQPPREVVEIIESYGDLDDRLHHALGPHWPYTLQKAREGHYARS